jgi:hypothetical protein
MDVAAIAETKGGAPQLTLPVTELSCGIGK